MSTKPPIEQALPILEDWAKEDGVVIEWFHEWARGWRQYVTAFGFGRDGSFRHTTVSWPIERPRLKPQPLATGFKLVGDPEPTGDAS